MTTLTLNVDLEKLSRAMQPLSDAEKDPILEALGFSPKKNTVPKEGQQENLDNPAGTR